MRLPRLNLRGHSSDGRHEVVVAFLWRTEIFGGLSLNEAIQTPTHTFLDCGIYCYNTSSFNEITVTAVESWHFSYWPHVIILVGKVPGGKLTNWQRILLLQSKTTTIALLLLIYSHSTGNLIYCTVDENFKVHEEIKRVPTLVWSTMFSIGLISGCQKKFLVFTLH